MQPELQQRMLAELEAQLSELDVERESIQAQMRELRSQTPAPTTGVPAYSPLAFPQAPLTKASTPEARLRFLLDLFHARRDVFAERFENRKTGKSGYQPVCANLWRRTWVAQMRNWVPCLDFTR